jgi:purine-nucleoside phosphorylase
MSISSLPFPEQVEKAADSLASRWPQRPRFGMVLGTGAGQLAESIKRDMVIDYAEVPFFPRSTALGHKGQFVCGTLAGKKVIAMEGRFHLYEGYPVDQATLPIHVMQKMGIRTLLVSNASGGINPKFASAEVMAISSHIDLMFRTSPAMLGPLQQNRPLIRSDFYNPLLIQQAIRCGRDHGFVVHEGVYAAMLGPNYETRAEYRFLRRIGGDVVGMSTVPEVTVAAKYGMQVLGLSVITNVAKPDVLDETSGQEVIRAAEIAAPKLKAIITRIISQSED